MKPALVMKSTSHCLEVISIKKALKEEMPQQGILKITIAVRGDKNETVKMAEEVIEEMRIMMTEEAAEVAVIEIGLETVQVGKEVEKGIEEEILEGVETGKEKEVEKEIGKGIAVEKGKAKENPVLDHEEDLGVGVGQREGVVVVREEVEAVTGEVEAERKGLEAKTEENGEVGLEIEEADHGIEGADLETNEAEVNLGRDVGAEKVDQGVGTEELEVTAETVREKQIRTKISRKNLL